MKDKVILLLDSDGDCEGIVLQAAAHTGRRIRVSRTSRDAFEAIRNGMSDLALVIIDADPAAHGLALLEAVSSCGNRPPIIAITGLEESYMKPIAEKHGAMACLAKPVSIARLKSAIDTSADWSLTCNRWGSPVPRLTKKIDIKKRFSGIAKKLSPMPPDRQQRP